MLARIRIGTLALLLFALGCVSGEQKLATVSSSSRSGPTRTQSAWMKQAPKATQKVALRVSEVGRKIAAANPNLDRKVAFLTLGVPQLEVFHNVRGGNGEIYITEGLVNECKSDGQLAAVLSQELGKMMSEEIAKSRPRRELPEPPPLLSGQIGNDIGGSFGPADGSQQMILARYEKDRRQARRAILPPPPADELARLYLQNAGFSISELVAVAPLLRKASRNDNLESLMAGQSAR